MSYLEIVDSYLFETTPIVPMSGTSKRLGGKALTWQKRFKVGKVKTTLSTMPFNISSKYNSNVVTVVVFKDHSFNLYIHPLWNERKKKDYELSNYELSTDPDPPILRGHYREDEREFNKQIRWVRTQMKGMEHKVILAYLRRNDFDFRGYSL